jgi:putative polyketide hydroxylase
LSGLQLDIYRVGGADLADPENRFCATYGLSPTGVCLVRPDGFVGWRAKSIEPDPSASLAKALRALLGRP